MTNIIRILGINTGLIILFSFILELAFGGWIGINYGIMVIPKDVYRKFDVSNLYDDDDGVTYYARDKHGLRGEYEDLSKIDILTIGGSTTNEIFIDEGNTWSDVIAHLFAIDNKKVTVVNAGLDGQTTIGHTKNFEIWFSKIPGIKTRYVLAYIGINDSAFLYNDHLNKQDLMYHPRRKIKQYLLNNSALYTLFRNIRGILRARSANLIHTQENWDGSEWTELPEQPDINSFIKEHAVALDAYASRVELLAKTIRDFGAEPIFVSQNKGNYRVRNGKVFLAPQKDGTLDASEFTTLMAVSRTTINACRKVNAVCIDLANELFFVDGDHYDGLHTTPKGSEKIGGYLYAKLKKLMLFAK